MRWLVTASSPASGRALCDWVATAGLESRVVLAPWRNEEGVDGLDALLLGGGGDVDPGRYGAAERHPATYGIDPGRDELECALALEFMRRRRPVFGICRGMQLLQVAMGGRLIQHIPDRVPEAAERHRKMDNNDAQHGVVVADGTRLGAALRGVREVNSAHHQALDRSTMPRLLSLVAISAAGVVEAVESVDPDLRVSAVQWHPERIGRGEAASAALLLHWRAVCEGRTRAAPPA